MFLWNSKNIEALVKFNVDWSFAPKLVENVGSGQNMAVSAPCIKCVSSVSLVSTVTSTEICSAVTSTGISICLDWSLGESAPCGCACAHYCQNSAHTRLETSLGGKALGTLVISNWVRWYPAELHLCLLCNYVIHPNSSLLLRMSGIWHAFLFCGWYADIAPLADWI